MNLGLKIVNDVEVTLMEPREILENRLSNNNIEYRVLFDKVVKDSSVKETILVIKDPEIEITLENDIVNYIKTSNNIYSQLDVIEEINKDVTVHIKAIKEKLAKKFDVDTTAINIEKCDLAKINITTIVNKDNRYYRIKIIRDAFGNVFINTIRCIR